MPSSDVAQLPIDDLLTRIEYVEACKARGLDLMEAAAAILGGGKPPQKLSHVLAAYLDSARADMRAMSPAQIRQMKQSFQLPISRLIAHFGDIDICQISTQEFGKVVYEIWPNEGIRGRIVNGRLYRLRKIFHAAQVFHGTKLPFDVTRFIRRVSPGPARPCFSTERITNRVLAPGGLAGLDTGHRGVLLALIDTGMRVTEAANLMADEVKLDGPIPHIHLKGSFRPLKTRNAYRIIPLTQVSLAAFAAHRKGFPDFRDDASLSSRLNRYLTVARLRETPRHSLHSFRHAYATRLAQAGVHETMIAELMGHKSARGYGRGYPLEMRHQAVMKGALCESIYL